MFRSLTNICSPQAKWLKNRKNRRKLLKNRKNRSMLRKIGKNRNLTPCSLKKHFPQIYRFKRFENGLGKKFPDLKFFSLILAEKPVFPWFPWLEKVFKIFPEFPDRWEPCLWSRSDAFLLVFHTHTAAKCCHHWCTYVSQTSHHDGSRISNFTRLSRVKNEAAIIVRRIFVHSYHWYQRSRRHVFHQVIEKNFFSQCWIILL